MSYAQAVKHSRNHRKDRFTQQCSWGPGGGHILSTRPRPDSPSKRAREYAAYRRALAATCWQARRDGESNARIQRFLATR